MQTSTSKIWLIGSIIFLVLVGCDGKDIDTIKPRIGEIHESFTEPSKTRLENTYLITMPVSGRIERIQIEPGDKVTKGQSLADFDLKPFNHAIAELEAQIKVKDDNQIEGLVMVEAKKTIEATEETLKAAEAQVEAAKATSEHRAEEYLRMSKVSRQGGYSDSQIDTARLEGDTAFLEYKKQTFYYSALKIFAVIVGLGPKYVDLYLNKKNLERKVLEVQLESAKYNLELARLHSPIDGVVLERYDQGDRTINAGERLMLLGNLDELEVISEVITQDALKLKIGSPVILEPASGIKPIKGKVKLIEPAGFTKFSSLGVEQQRVKVIVSIDGERGALGVGYRVQAKFFTGSKTDALIVPRFSILQAPDGSYYVLNVKENKIKKQTVKIGLRSDLELEITEGLDAKDTIVATPDTSIKDGDRVKGN